jgi:asparagine synthase (glutamine-hydrolysing)
VVVRSVAAIRHRGPDDEGYVWIDTVTGASRAFGGDDTPAVLRSKLAHVSGAHPDPDADLVLASRRLAIQDLSTAGHQPMTDGRRWLTYNGEIYNFGEVRRELEALGHRFRSNTDTEVLLHAYDEWGTGCLDRLNGMWAFALWDGRRRTLVLARDRFGVKPLFYSWDGDRIVFASEIKALLGVVRPETNRSVLDDYLAYGHVDESDETFFTGVSQLPPGHLIDLAPGDAGPRVRAWYRLPTSSRDPAGDRARCFRELLENAVHLRLISDVPVGTCLSGGLDSSAIACMVDRLLRSGDRAGVADRQLTFSARYDDQRHDEGRYIDAVRTATAIEPHFSRPTGSALLGDLDALVWHQEEPFGSTSIYAQWTVFKLAREHGVVVTLDGQGGDEVAGGYHHYFGPNLARLLRAGRLHDFAQEVAAVRQTHAASARWLATRTGAALLPWGVRRRLAARLRKPDWLLPTPGSAPSDVPLAGMPRDPLAAQIYRDVTVGLRQLLRVCDRNSMAHSVESRLPFLDFRLLEFGYTTPAEAKLSNGTTKVTMRQALDGLLPEAVRGRPGKVGFSTPEDSWFRGELRPFVEEIFGSESFRSRPQLDVSAVWRMYAEHLNGHDHSRAIWRLLNAELWQRRFVD